VSVSYIIMTYDLEIAVDLFFLLFYYLKDY